MAVGLIFAGVLAGLASAIATLLTGGGLLAAFGAYTLAGMIFMIVALCLIALPRFYADPPDEPVTACEGFQHRA